MKIKVLSVVLTTLTVSVLTNFSIANAALSYSDSGFKLAQTSRFNRSKPQITQQHQQNFDNLKSDLLAIQSKSEVTPQQKEELANSLMTLIEGTTKPSQQSVQKLANDLSEALDDGNLSSQEIYQLSKDIEAVLNSANIPPREVQAVINDAFIDS